MLVRVSWTSVRGIAGNDLRDQNTSRVCVIRQVLCYYVIMLIICVPSTSIIIQACVLCSLEDVVCRAKTLWLVMNIKLRPDQEQGTCESRGSTRCGMRQVQFSVPIRGTGDKTLILNEKGTSANVGTR